MKHRTRKWICTFGSDSFFLDERIVVAEPEVRPML